MNLTLLIEFLSTNAQIILGAFIGFGSGFGLQVVLDRLTRPELFLSIGEINDGHKSKMPKHRFLQVRIENKSSKIFSRKAALSCIVKLIYRGKQKELLVMNGRWSTKSQPLSQLIIDRKLITVPDFPNIYLTSKEDIPAGDINASQVAVGLKYDGQQEFCGFNDQSYAFGDWKNPSFLIKNSECGVEVNVYSGDRQWSKKFKIFNKTSKIEDFELTSA